MTNNFGICVWHPDMGNDLVYPEDLQDFPQLTTAIFRSIGVDGEWLKIQYGTHQYRVKPELFKPVSTPKFSLGSEVFVPSKSMVGKVITLTWHHKNEEPIYNLSFNGKKSSRRYSENELSSIKN